MDKHGLKPLFENLHLVQSVALGQVGFKDVHCETDKTFDNLVL